jgi:hypothetical protein
MEHLKIYTKCLSDEELEYLLKCAKKEAAKRKQRDPNSLFRQIDDSIWKNYDEYKQWQKRAQPMYKTLGFTGWSPEEFKEFMTCHLNGAVAQNRSVFLEYIEKEVPEREEAWRNSL